MNTEEIRIEELTSDNFAPDALDDFVRRQSVTEVYRRIEGKYRLVVHPFEEDWSLGRRREKAAEILNGEYLTYGAFAGNRVIGEIMLERSLRQGRLVVLSLHVSEEYRHQGVGSKLFVCARKAAEEAGAKELYISACSAKETIAFYRAMGCTLADPVIEKFAEDEPCDLQLVCAVDACR